MKKKKIKGIMAFVDVLVIIVIFILGSVWIKSSNKFVEEQIKNLENTKNTSIEVYSDIISRSKSINITDVKDINELVDIFKNVTFSKLVHTTNQSDYYVPKIAFYNSFNNKIIEVSLYNLDVTIDGKIIDITDKKVKRVKEIINKYTGNAYGKIVCQNDISMEVYYLYDNNIIKYVNEIKDLTENANFDTLNEYVAESERKSHYSAFLIYNSKTYGQIPDEVITLKDGYYYFSKTYLIDKMNEQELKDLLNMSKADFENKTIKDIESKYMDSACKHIIL